MAQALVARTSRLPSLGATCRGSRREARVPLVVRRAQETEAQQAQPQQPQQQQPAQAASPPSSKKPSPLEKGGTKDAGPKAAAKQPASAPKFYMQIVDGRFKDDRWVDGRWDLSQFAGPDGQTDWDKVIDAEIGRRKLLEATPISCMNEDPVNFDTSEIPWWAWVKRFHLPEAEKLNGRAAMVGYFLAIFVDKFTGHGLAEQQNSFLGMLALHITVFGILAIRQNADFQNLRNLFDEATYYDRQWNATWDNVKRPSEAKE